MLQSNVIPNAIKVKADNTYSSTPNKQTFYFLR